MNLCCSDDSCRPCTGDAGKPEVPELLKPCFGSSLDFDDEPVTNRTPQPPWTMEPANCAPYPYAAKLAKTNEDWRGGAAYVPSPSQDSPTGLQSMLSPNEAVTEHWGPQLETPADDAGATEQPAPAQTFVEDKELPAYVEPGHVVPVWPTAVAGMPEAEEEKPPPPPPKSLCSCFDSCEAYPVMDAKAVLKEATWCFFCCCMGCGSGPIAHLRWLIKCACCRQMCETTPCVGSEGCIGCLCSLACCHALVQLPPRIGAPRCVCCGEIFCGLHDCGAQKSAGSSVAHGQEEDKFETPDHYDHILLEGFSPAYCCCCGCACKTEVATCIHSVSKCCCCEFVCKTGRVIDDDGLLFSLITCWRLYGHCRCPPAAEENPVCACCGKRWRTHRDHHGAMTQIPVNSAPTQLEMT